MSRISKTLDNRRSNVSNNISFGTDISDYNYSRNAVPSSIHRDPIDDDYNRRLPLQRPSYGSSVSGNINNNSTVGHWSTHKTDRDYFDSRHGQTDYTSSSRVENYSPSNNRWSGRLSSPTRQHGDAGFNRYSGVDHNDYTSYRQSYDNYDQYDKATPVPASSSFPSSSSLQNTSTVNSSPKPPKTNIPSNSNITTSPSPSPPNKPTKITKPNTLSTTPTSKSDTNPSLVDQFINRTQIPAAQNRLIIAVALFAMPVIFRYIPIYLFGTLMTVLFIVGLRVYNTLFTVIQSPTEMPISLRCTIPEIVSQWSHKEGAAYINDEIKRVALKALIVALALPLIMLIVPAWAYLLLIFVAILAAVPMLPSSFALKITPLADHTRVYVDGKKWRCESAQGEISEITPVTLNAANRKLACIPQSAVKFCWAYQPDTPCSYGEVTLDIFLKVGGFIYFDQSDRIVAVNTVEPGKKKKVAGLAFDGPYIMDIETSKKIQHLGHKVTLKGSTSDVISYAWIPANYESSMKIPNGGFAYFCQDNNKNYYMPVLPR